MINGLLAWRSGGGMLPFSWILVNILGGRTCRKEHWYTNITNQYATIWCMHETWQNGCIGLMQLRPDGFEPFWIKDSSFKLINGPFKCFILFCTKHQVSLLKHAWNQYRWIDWIFLIIFQYNLSDLELQINFYDFFKFVVFSRISCVIIIPVNKLLHQHYVRMTSAVNGTVQVKPD